MQFGHLNSIYRNYDIRGKAPEELNGSIAVSIGKAFTEVTKPKTVVVGHDIRSSSPQIRDGLIEGLISMGVDVVDIGLVSTSMLYFATGHLNMDGGIMITGSHLPCDQNGMKLCRKNAVPISIDSGILDIRDAVIKNNFNYTGTSGIVTEVDIKKDYYDYIVSLGNVTRKFTVVIDPGNMMGIEEIPIFKNTQESMEVHSIYDSYDETCPNHEPNPIKFETLKDLGEKVRSVSADIGVAFDGDADRTGIVDEHGEPVPADIIGTLIAKQILTIEKGATFVYDLRSSRIVKETIEKNGGIAIESRVGHSFIKEVMRKHEAVFGMELVGHYFFRDHYYTEAGPLPALLILKLMEVTGKSLSKLVDEVKVYTSSGEINSTIIRQPDAIYADLKKLYKDAKISEVDGIKVEYEEWWFNARPSANDPVMRLNLEGTNEKIVDKKLSEVLAIIRS